MTDVLQVEQREKLGTAETRRMRRSGRVPAVLYGHGQKNEHLSIPYEDIKLLLRHRSKTVELKGHLTDTALVSQMQWDALGINVIHLDLIRVDLKELVQVTVPVSIYGDAPGLREGGIMLESMHEVDISCPAGMIPESVIIDVNELHSGHSLTAIHVKLPAEATLVTSPDAVVVRVEAPKGRTADEDEAAPLEPEVIAKGGGEKED